SAQRDHERLERVPYRVVRRRRLVAAMHHAVGAFLVIARPVLVPVGRLHELLEAPRIAFAEEIAGALPAEHVARRVAPRGAVVLLIAGEEVEEETRLREAPLLAAPAPEDVAEELLGLVPREGVLLVRRALVGVARRNGDGVDLELEAREVEEGGDALGIEPVEERGVHADAEAARLGLADRGHDAVEDAVLAHRMVVLLLETVEMDGEGEVGRGLEEVELLLQEERVGAEVDELLARDDALDDLVDLLVEQRLAAGNRHYRRAAFVDRLQAFRDREALVEDLIGIVDLAAADAGEVAAEQRLEHEHERIARVALEALLEHKRADARHLEE